MENVLISSANLVALPIIYYSDGFKRATLLAYMFTSILYHLFECEKHDMIGLRKFRSRKSQLYLSNVNRTMYTIMLCFQSHSIAIHLITLLPMITMWIALYFICELLEIMRERRNKYDDFTDVESLELIFKSSKDFINNRNFLRNIYVFSQISLFFTFYGILFQIL